MKITVFLVLVACAVPVDSETDTKCNYPFPVHCTSLDVLLCTAVCTPIGGYCPEYTTEEILHCQKDAQGHYCFESAFVAPSGCMGCNPMWHFCLEGSIP